MTNTASLKKRVLTIVVMAIIAPAIIYDYQFIHRDFQGKAIEDSFIAAYPTINLYRKYIARIINNNPDVTTHHFFPLHETRDDERVVSINSVALIDLQDGPVTLTFPDLTLFHQATATFVDWDGLAIGGESANNLSYTLLPPNSVTSATSPQHLTAKGHSVLVFLRIPTHLSPPAEKLPEFLKKIRFTDATGSPKVKAPLSIIQECGDPELGNTFIACMEILSEAMKIPAKQKEAFYTAKNKIQSLSKMDDPLWESSVAAAQRMIYQTLTNSIGLVTSNMWIAYEDMFTPKPSTMQPLLNRAAYIHANFITVPSDKMKYAIKRYNARGEAIEGTLHDYVLHFDPARLPTEINEWHFVIGDHRYKFYARPNTRSSIKNTDALQWEKDGSVRLVFATELPPGVAASNWLPIPKSPFQIVFMGRATRSDPSFDSFDSFDYLEELEIIR